MKSPLLEIPEVNPLELLGYLKCLVVLAKATHRCVLDGSWYSVVLEIYVAELGVVQSLVQYGSP